MTRDELIETKLYRLEELRRYQSYYGPNTPYPVIVEINDLEVELQSLIQASQVRPRPSTKKKKKKPDQSLWHVSGRTFDAIATISFIGLVFLFGSIIVAAYVKTRPEETAMANEAEAVVFENMAIVATLRPTFTPTLDPDNPPAEAMPAPVLSVPEGESMLPPANREPTAIPTPVPTLTPSSTPVPTEPPPPPTDTPAPPPLPTEPPPPPQPAAVRPAPTATPAAPTATPAPAFPFMVAEQGNRAFQRTNNNVIIVYVAAVSEGNIPIGDLKVIGDHTPSGMHVESAPSDWFWSVTNCLDCDYVKQGNIKFEPGNFFDGVWNIYLADLNGTPLSPVVPLSYSADPSQWIWDFIIFRRVSG